MHCPQCGLQQTSGEARFCRACGFSLNDLKELLVPEARNTKVDKYPLPPSRNRLPARVVVDARQLVLSNCSNLAPRHPLNTANLRQDCGWHLCGSRSRADVFTVLLGRRRKESLVLISFAKQRCSGRNICVSSCFACLSQHTRCRPQSAARGYGRNGAAAQRNGTYYEAAR